MRLRWAFCHQMLRADDEVDDPPPPPSAWRAKGKERSEQWGGVWERQGGPKKVDLSRRKMPGRKPVEWVKLVPASSTVPSPAQWEDGKMLDAGGQWKGRTGARGIERCYLNTALGVGRRTNAGARHAVGQWVERAPCVSKSRYAVCGICKAHPRAFIGCEAIADETSLADHHPHPKGKTGGACSVFYSRTNLHLKIFVVQEEVMW